MAHGRNLVEYNALVELMLSQKFGNQSTKWNEKVSQDWSLVLLRARIQDMSFTFLSDLDKEKFVSSTWKAREGKRKEHDCMNLLHGEFFCVISCLFAIHMVLSPTFSDELFPFVPGYMHTDSLNVSLAAKRKMVMMTTTTMMTTNNKSSIVGALPMHS